MTTTEDHPRTVITPERRAALEDHVAHFLADNPGSRYYPALAIRDAIEHGWQGATADIAERLEEIVRGDGPTLEGLARLIDSLKREVGA